jgi:hypothetical protein
MSKANIPFNLIIPSIILNARNRVEHRKVKKKYWNGDSF